ncbi:Uncharacterized protein APZ42_007115 [Daphnia magna]|uniref:Uncharacterized protein n=1 Tax=Daphnia magna TaxID=35525 RepID=A0A164FHN5_9CRUS|nr:Uncharacterized protein APZ42_007115 [Daphnia magna]
MNHRRHKKGNVKRRLGLAKYVADYNCLLKNFLMIHIVKHLCLNKLSLPQFLVCQLQVE